MQRILFLEHEHGERADEVERGYGKDEEQKQERYPFLDFDHSEIYFLLLEAVFDGGRLPER
jgi:hypothetical protein